MHVDNIDVFLDAYNIGQNLMPSQHVATRRFHSVTPRFSQRSLITMSLFYHLLTAHFFLPGLYSLCKWNIITLDISHFLRRWLYDFRSVGSCIFASTHIVFCQLAKLFSIFESLTVYCLSIVKLIRWNTWVTQTLTCLQYSLRDICYFFGIPSNNLLSWSIRSKMRWRRMSGLES